MSIIIKGVKMPKEGNYEARLNVNRDGTALLFLYGECGGHEAKEIPPHGRLIDADEILWEMRKKNDFGELTAKSAMRAVKYAPTIIEAEEEE